MNVRVQKEAHVRSDTDGPVWPGHVGLARRQKAEALVLGQPLRIDVGFEGEYARIAVSVPHKLLARLHSANSVVLAADAEHPNGTRMASEKADDHSQQNLRRRFWGGSHRDTWNVISRRFHSGARF